MRYKSERIERKFKTQKLGHSLLLGEDGVVYFVGTARRGEDGDQTKARRPPKPVKPKVFSRLEGQNVSYVSLTRMASFI